MSERTKQKLDEAIAIVEEKFGKGTSNDNSELVAAVLQSLALEEHASCFHKDLEKMTEDLCRAAAVASGD